MAQYIKTSATLPDGRMIYECPDCKSKVPVPVGMKPPVHGCRGVSPTACIHRDPLLWASFRAEDCDCRKPVHKCANPEAPSSLCSPLDHGLYEGTQVTACVGCPVRVSG